MNSLILLSFLVVFVNIFSEIKVAAQGEPLVNIDQGTLKGQELTLTKDTGFVYYSFKGIPYAQPPIGDLRFKPPQAPPSWEDVRNATDFGPNCLQIQSLTGDVTGDEDCLYLNVYTPQLPAEDEKLNINVMVYIHGGAWVSGSGSGYGPDCLIEKEIILVTINYRLGALGFLGLNHTDFSKNNGLKDQAAALKWVKNNIEKFGGNPESVTIFGESAGGMSVSYHLISPASKGLFQRAISESGSCLDSDGFINPDLAHQRAFALGNVLGYSDEDPAGLIEFLKEENARTITENQGSAYAQDDIEHGSDMLIYLPTVEYGDDIYVPDYPLNLLKSGKINQVPYITGVNSKEGKLFALDYKAQPARLSNIDEHFEWYIPRDLGYELGSKESLAATEEVRTLYFGNNSISEDTIEGLVDFLGDTKIITGVHRKIKILSTVGTAPLFVYVFSYIGKLSRSNSYNYSFPGASHADELDYIFSSGAEVESNSTEMETIHRMTTMWTNFAKSLDPTSGLDFSWNPLTKDDNTYLSIDTELKIEDLNNFAKQRNDVWDSLYEKLDSF